jgi:hypothetical protein
MFATLKGAACRIKIGIQITTILTTYDCNAPFSGEDTPEMEAELHQIAAGASPALDRAWRDVVFSVGGARRALPYVARVTQDAAEAFREVQFCRSALRDPVLPLNQRGLLSQQRDMALHRLDGAIDECNAVGVDLVDFARGTVRFSAELNGQHMSLLWRLGEPITGAWIELLDPSG